jgi:2'-5' RNA ligase
MSADEIPQPPSVRRLFIAVPCPLTAAVRELMTELRTLARDGNSGLRVVNASTLHVTLKFLGTTAASKIPAVVAVMEQTLKDLAPFTLTLSGAGSFHGALWLGVAPEPRLSELAERLNSALSPLGFAPEGKPFLPHLTLARLGRKPAIDIGGWVKACKGGPISGFLVRGVNLYQSDTSDTQARYCVLHTTPLTTA